MQQVVVVNSDCYHNTILKPFYSLYNTITLIENTGGKLVSSCLFKLWIPPISRLIISLICKKVYQSIESFTELEIKS